MGKRTGKGGGQKGATNQCPQGLGGGCRWGVTLVGSCRGSLETVTTGHHGIPDEEWESRAIYTTASVSHWVRATSGSCKFPDSSGFQCAQTKRSNRQANLQQRCTVAYLQPLSTDPWQHLLQLLILHALQSAFMVEIFLQRKKKNTHFFPERKFIGFRKLLLERKIQLSYGKSAEWWGEDHKGVSRAAYHEPWEKYTFTVRNSCHWKAMSVRSGRKQAAYSSVIDITTATAWLYGILTWEVLRNTEAWGPAPEIQIQMLSTLGLFKASPGLPSWL